MKSQFMKQYRKQPSSENFQPSTCASTQNSEFKERRKQYIKQYRKRKQASLCTCCDQLWYKHSVVPATTLKENNPDVHKRLLNKVSVNNVEWLCQTGNKHLKNNKVPPCAIINVMQFPKSLYFID